MISRIGRCVLFPLFALSLVVFSVVMMPNTAQANDVPPPAPTFLDRCGTAFDETYIPLVDGASYFRNSVADGNGMAEDVYHPMNGATYVKIVAEYSVIGPDGLGYSKQHVFEYTFDTSAPDGCKQAANTGKVSVGACNPSTGGTQITVTFTNVADSSGYPYPSVYFTGQGSAGNTWHVRLSDKPVLDGQSVSWTGGQSVDQPVYPGEYSGTFTTVQVTNVLLADVRFTVPACGNREFPESGGGGSAGGATARPVASLKLLRCQTGRVRATMSNQRVAAASRFRIVQNPARGKTVTRNYTVKPRKVKRIYRTGSNTAYKVYVWNAKTKRWNKPVKLRTPPETRCNQ